MALYMRKTFQAAVRTATVRIPVRLWYAFCGLFDPAQERMARKTAVNLEDEYEDVCSAIAEWERRRANPARETCARKQQEQPKAA